MSRLSVTRGDVAACWSNTARLQEAAGKAEEAAQSRETAKRVRSTNGWMKSHGRY